jgi:hypothetical protein
VPADGLRTAHERRKIGTMGLRRPVSARRRR